MAANKEDVNRDTESLQKDTMKGFQSFKVVLADILTFAMVVKLAHLFGYPPSIMEELEERNTTGTNDASTDSKGTNTVMIMIRCMEKRGQIEPTDITTLLSGLKQLRLSGTESSVRKQFEHHTGIICSDNTPSKKQIEDKIGYFVDSLRNTYARWYNKIKPIPYIKGKEYCVNDVYVESGVKVLQPPTSSKQRNSEDNLKDEPKTLLDIFDSSKISTNRILLEGDPGYGKSTFTLQAAYQWCSGSESSPLKMFRIFILLPLRLLKNISSIYEGIRLYLMPAEVELTDDDIKEILISCSFVIIVLDGYDEYPDKYSESDFNKIIKGTMFAKFKVVLTSRSSSLPRDLDPSTVTIKLTGFDDTSMYEYIKRAVTDGNEEKAKKIKDILNSSPVLADIWQIPIFSVMFAHLTKEQPNSVARFSSVTSFFRYIISCFYSHMSWRSLPNETSDAIPDYKELNSLAFDSLVDKTQRWPKNSFTEAVGEECYRELSSIGILVEEEDLVITDEPGVDINKPIAEYQQFVRFYHKLFAEWYAAHYLSSRAGSIWPILLGFTLDKIDPVDFQYVFRFASGLNKRACDRIVRYLRGMNGGETFASLCLFEQSKDHRRTEKILRGLCSGGMTIRSTDSKLSQRSNTQLLDIVSRNKIPVSCLMLDQSLVSADIDELTLKDGLRISALASLQKLEVKTEIGKEYTTETFFGFLSYGRRCESLKHICFNQCLLPLHISTESLSSTTKYFNGRVSWQPFEDEFALNSLTGTWNLIGQQSAKFEDNLVAPSLCSEILAMYSGKLILQDDESEERHKTIILLKTSLKNNIPISCLVLEKTLLRADQSGLTTQNQYCVPILPTLEKLEVQDESKITQETILGLICYVNKCPKLTNITFSGCLLPLSFPEGMLSSAVHRMDVQVFWRPSDCEFYLDWTRGHWELSTQQKSGWPKDKLTLAEKCKKTMFLKATDSKQLQSSMILLLEIASRQRIPISELFLTWSFKEFDGDNIRLVSGLNISSLSSVEKITVNGRDKLKLCENQVTDVINYGMKSEIFKELWFLHCGVPPSVNPALITKRAKTRNVKVMSSNEAQCLNLESGKWKKPEDIQDITLLCSGPVVIDNDRDKSVQRSVIDLLVNASEHDIPIHTVTLISSFKKIDEDGTKIILRSGLSVPILSSTERMYIQTEQGREMNEQETNGILRYLEHNSKLKTLDLEGCVLPARIRLDQSVATTLKSRNVKVFWFHDSNKNDQYYRLDFDSGHFEKEGAW